jgi:hypothetical protein
MTPLMGAVGYNHINMLPLLLERGADINIADQVSAIKEGEGGVERGDEGGNQGEGDGISTSAYSY